MDIKIGDRFKRIGYTSVMEFEIGHIVRVTEHITASGCTYTRLYNETTNQEVNGCWSVSDPTLWEKIEPEEIELDVLDTESFQIAQQIEPEESALRSDTDKLRLDLIPPEWLIELARVKTFGAKKYEDHNWKKGMKFSRAIGSAMRHLLKWTMGGKLDSESGCHHLAHAAWNMLALMSWELKGLTKWDDRQKSDIYDEELKWKSK